MRIYYVSLTEKEKLLKQIKLLIRNSDYTIRIILLTDSEYKILSSGETLAYGTPIILQYSRYDEGSHFFDRHEIFCYLNEVCPLEGNPIRIRLYCV